MARSIRFELRHLKAFLAVAEQLHFKKAADSLFITQPALSRLIKSLEEEVGAELLVRTTRQVALSEAGRLFLEECKRAFLHIERGMQLAQRASEGDIGRITVAYNDISINGELPLILETFKERYPGISVALSYVPSHLQHQAILDAKIDFGFLIGPFEHQDVETVLVSREETVVVLPIKHPLAGRRSIALAELADERFIFGTEDGWHAFRLRVFEYFRQAGIAPQVIQEASTSNGIFGLVAANMGISLYSECVRNFKRESISVVPLEERHMTIETVAAWNTLYESSSARLFKQHLDQHLNLSAGRVSAPG